MMILWQVSVRECAVSDIVSKLSERRVPFGRMSYEGADDVPGLYCFWVRGTCLYVGKSDTSLKRRLKEHCEAEDNPLLRENFEAYGKDIEMVIVNYDDISKKRLGELEFEAIRNMKPLANRQGIT